MSMSRSLSETKAELNEVLIDSGGSRPRNLSDPGLIRRQTGVDSLVDSEEIEALLTTQLDSEKWIDDAAMDAAVSEPEVTKTSDGVSCVFFRRLGNVMALSLGLGDKLGPGWVGVDWLGVAVAVMAIGMNCVAGWLMSQLVSPTGSLQAPNTGCFTVEALVSANWHVAQCGQNSTASVVGGLIAYCFVAETHGLIDQDLRLADLRDSILQDSIVPVLWQVMLPFVLCMLSFVVLGEWLSTRMFNNLSKRLMTILFTDDKVPCHPYAQLCAHVCPSSAESAQVLYRLVLGDSGAHFEPLYCCTMPISTFSNSVYFSQLLRTMSNV